MKAQSHTLAGSLAGSSDLEPRLFRVLLIVSAVIYPVCAATFLFQARPLFAWLCAGGMGSIAVAWWLGRRLRRIGAGMQAWAAGAMGVLAVLTYFEGGVSAPAATWLCLIPFVFVVASRFREAALWAAVGAGVLGTWYGLERLGHAFPRDLGMDPALMWLCNAVFFSAAVLGFAVMGERVRRDLLATLHGRNAELLSARDEALAASAAKARFLATMSHEIRTPLNGVLGATDVLGETRLDTEQQQLVELMRHSGRSLLGLINDVLDYSKIESGRLTLERIAFDPREVAEQVAELWSPLAAEKGVEIVCRVALDVPPRVLGDPLRLRQILTNLTGNAIKFTAAGRVTLDVSRMNGTHGGQLPLRMTVSDTGIGMDRATLTGLFQAFRQADASIARTHGGSGLGLVIAKELTEMLGGKIGVESRLGEGSRFTCEIPFEVAEAVDSRRHGADLVGMIAVVLEPRSATRAVIEEYLMAEGVQVVKVDDPAALRAFIDVPPHVRVAALVSAEAVARDEGPDRVWLDLPEAARARITLLARPGEAGDAVRRLAPGTPILYKPVRRAALLAALHRSESSAAAPEGSEAPGRAGVRVLVADDSPVNRKLAGMMLQRLGCSVAMAEDGAEAVRAWDTGLHDIVFMDCQMPVWDGLAATREIRRLERASGRARTPIVALTANAFSEDRAACLEAGMDDFLAKPVSQAVLRAKLLQWTAPPPEEDRLYASA